MGAPPWDLGLAATAERPQRAIHATALLRAEGDSRLTPPASLTSGPSRAIGISRRCNASVPDQTALRDNTSAHPTRKRLISTNSCQPATCESLCPLAALQGWGPRWSKLPGRTMIPRARSPPKASGLVKTSTGRETHLQHPALQRQYAHLRGWAGEVGTDFPKFARLRCSGSEFGAGAFRTDVAELGPVASGPSLARYARPEIRRGGPLKAGQRRPLSAEI